MRALLLVSLGLLGPLTSGCTPVGVSAPPPATDAPPAPAAGPEAVAFRGTVTLGGRGLQVHLELTSDGRGEVRDAVVHLPDLAVDAVGRGTWGDGILEIQLSYDTGGCPGVIRVRAALDASGSGLEGTLEASDCTGSASGPLRLSRRDAPGPSGPRPR